MGALERLYELCRWHELSVTLELVGPTGHPVKGEPIFPDGELRLRVLLAGEIVCGRAQSQPGAETVDELAGGCLESLRKRGLRGA